jgi:predicted unusual protein kinase regulating ubiquinone biosynthesis (AarF/ABC1/UbiB family)
MANGTADFYFVNIIDSKTDKIENNDLVFNALVQLFLSTISFQICTGMQHSDTHFGNFLYHKIKPGNTNISTTFYNFTINIKNMGYLWVINDFGLAESLNDKSNIKMNESYIVKIINDYKEILKELTRYNRFFKDETIPNFISEMMGYLNPELYSENKFNLLHINILNCFLKYTTTVSSSNIKQ